MRSYGRGGGWDNVGRQGELYNDTANIYEPDPLATKTGSIRLKDVKINPTPIATNVKGMFLSKPEAAEGGGPIGRTEKDLVLVSLDRWRCRADAKRDDGTPLQLMDTYIVQITTSDNPDRLGWWICAGGSKIRTRPNTQTVNMKKTLEPPGIS